jgi:hypothetical protein
MFSTKSVPESTDIEKTPASYADSYRILLPGTKKMIEMSKK